ncbi:MAG: PIG-L family deacetylase [Pseudonocardiales bacterium]|nr:PIG-L family deacetylase [Pseudonocardiales bacterium]MBV9030171.1 PIG-L family deacetylase [Pseudonocardiales bacterium]MBW0009102.1 PIG-L family deacetylase [Pseudonocardiales bacterium]
MTTVRRVLAVSPHLDDAALSAGATLADFAIRGADVHVVTLFAGAPHEPISPVARAFHVRGGLPQDASAVALRSAEDRAAMDQLGARTHHRGFLDAIYRRTPEGRWLCGHDQAMFDELPLDQGDLRGEVCRDVRRILAAIDPDLVLTCAAVGDHVDHRLTRAAVLDAAAGARAPVLLWEDLPYAIGRPPPPALSETPAARSDAWERKWRAIACYPTQIRMLWPAHVDWAAQLRSHAETRGQGSPAELLAPGLS